jgi:fused signal recognition particle receptor
MFWRRKKKEAEPKPQDVIEYGGEVIEFEDQEALVLDETGQVSEEELDYELYDVLEKPTTHQGMFTKLRDRLRDTRESIAQRTLTLLQRTGKIDDEFLDDLEEILIAADVGVETTLELMDELRERIRREKKANSSDAEWLTNTLRDLMREMLEQGERGLELVDNGPSIYLVIGVNGVGKTTAIGKLAHRCMMEGKSVMLVAADTFRAAAIEQLEVWARRAQVGIHSGQEGADPSSIVYNALNQAREEKPDIIIIDTAGRLHTKSNLMQELNKMSRIISREYEGAPHEILLVLDASTGQNAFSQARQFMQTCGITGLILTKLDGTAKGGIVFTLHKQLQLPVKFIGVGEGINDLEPFDPEAFTRALFAVPTA